MRARILIELSGSEITCTLVRRGQIVARHSATFETTAEIADAAKRALAELPDAGRVSAALTVSAPRCQVRHLEGLPAVTDRSLLNRIVRENSTAFFLRPSGRLLISDVWAETEGVFWGAAFDHAPVEEISSAVLGAGHTIDAVGPGRDGGKSQHFIDSAGQLTTRSPLVWRPPRSPAYTRLIRRLSIAAAALILFIAGAAAVAAPGLHAMFYERSASRELAPLRRVELDAAHTTAELRRATQLLDAVAAFETERGRVTRLLGDLSHAIPDSTALVSFRVDSAEGSFVAIAPHVMDVLSGLGNVSGLSVPHVVGSITRESIANVRLERATVRFRRPRSGPR